MLSSTRPHTPLVFVSIVLTAFAGLVACKAGMAPSVADSQAMSKAYRDSAGAPATNPVAATMAAWPTKTTSEVNAAKTKAAQDLHAWQTRTTGEVNAAKTRVAAEQTRLASELKTKTAPIVNPRVAIETYAHEILGVTVVASNARQATRSDGDKIARTDEQGRVFRAAWSAASIHHTADLSSNGKTGTAVLSYNLGGIAASNPEDWNAVLAAWSVGLYALSLPGCPSYSNAQQAFADAQKIYPKINRVTWKPLPAKTGYAWFASHADNGGNANQLKGGLAILSVAQCQATILVAMGGAGKLQ